MTGWPTHEFPTICPFCGQHHEAATYVSGDKEEATPVNGNTSLCFMCGRFCVFDSDAYGGLRKPNTREQRAIDRDEKLKELLVAWEIMNRQ